jgi:hypothetical protein
MLPSQNSFPSAKPLRPCKPSSLHLSEESQRRYQTIAADRKYRHFTRIPRRILRCLDYFGVNCDSVVVERRLRAYYLFIGVIDNAIDSGQLQVSRIVLRQFESRPTRFDQSGNISEIALVTERLLDEISDETYPELLRALHALSAAVEHERTAASMAEYIEARKQVGQLTAKSSFLVIRPLLSAESSHICHFMESVGEIGCLVDSVIDLNADRSAGLLNFQSTPRDFFRLVTYSVKRGVKLSIEYPQLFALFLEAVADNVLDRFRTRGNPQPQKIAKRTVTIDAAPTV